MIQLVHLTNQKPEYRLLMPSAAVSCIVINSTVSTSSSEHPFSMQWRQLPGKQAGSQIQEAHSLTAEKPGRPEHHHLFFKRGYRELVIRMNDPMAGVENCVTLMLDVELTKTEEAGES